MGISRKSASIPIGSNSPQQHQQKNSVMGLECGYFDVQPVQQLSKSLLLTLATACVERSSGDLFSGPKSIASEVRQELLDFITQECERCSESAIMSEMDDPVCLIEGFLENFIRSRKTLLRRVVSSKFFRRSISGASNVCDDHRIDEVVAELDRSGIWPESRRDSLARLLLKRVDKKNRKLLFCDRSFDSNEDLIQHKLKCRLRPVDCPSNGCDVIFSSARSAEHDSLCLFKLLPCEQNCKAMVMRGEMLIHCSSACDMKPVDCPFRVVGCSRLIPQAQIQRHCDQETGTHLLSLLQVVQRLDNSADSQCQRIVLLEKAVSITRRSFTEGVDSPSPGSLMTTIKEQEMKIKSLEQELGKLRQEMKATDVSAEVLQLRRELRNLQKRVDSLNLNPPISPKNGLSAGHR